VTGKKVSFTYSSSTGRKGREGVLCLYRPLFGREKGETRKLLQPRQFCQGGVDLAAAEEEETPPLSLAERGGKGRGPAREQGGTGCRSRFLSWGGGGDAWGSGRVSGFSPTKNRTGFSSFLDGGEKRLPPTLKKKTLSGGVHKKGKGEQCPILGPVDQEREGGKKTPLASP